MFQSAAAPSLMNLVLADAGLEISIDLAGHLIHQVPTLHMSICLITADACQSRLASNIFSCLFNRCVGQ